MSPFPLIYIDPESAEPTMALEGVTKFPAIGTCDLYLTLNQYPNDWQSLVWGASAWVGKDTDLDQKRFSLETLFDHEDLFAALPSVQILFGSLRLLPADLGSMERSYFLKGILVEIMTCCQITLEPLGESMNLHFRPYRTHDDPVATMVCELTKEQSWVHNTDYYLRGLRY